MPDTPRTITFWFNAPNRPLSINESLHWAAKRRRLEPWRTLTSIAYRNIADANATPFPVEITVTIPFERGGRRDPHNYTGTIVKAIVDTLVNEGLVPDDTAEWVRVNDPILIHPATQVKVEIKERVQR